MGNHCMTSLKPLDIIRRAPKPTTSTSGQASDISSSIVTPSTDNTSYSSTISCSSAPSPSSSSFQTYIDESGNPSRSSSSHLISFSFNDLKLATRNFRPENFLGEGGFGSVYKGWIDQQTHTVARPGAGMSIAVKRLNRESMQGHKEWLMELHFLSQLHHPNLVKLYGFCAEDEQRLLVYEFMPRGSLENHLFRRASISWELRMKIIMGAANALAFLHDSSVIYRDFKTSNILLDSEFNAKLSDFGLAKGGPTGLKTHTSTSVVGTNGYAAPEYVSTGHLSLRSDLYSFGVVLLEILTGRPVLDGNRPTLEQNLVSWSKPFLGDKKKLYRLTDPRLEGKYSSQGVTTIASLAWRCLQADSKLRPQMGEIVRALEPLVASKEAISSTRTRRSKYMKEAIATKPQCCQNG